MRTGIIKWWDSRKGYGFVVPLDKPGDVLLHGSLCNKVPASRNRLAKRLRARVKSRPTPTGERVTEIELEPTFAILELPRECSHRFAVRCETTGEVAVFHSKDALDTWCEITRRRLFNGEA